MILQIVFNNNNRCDCHHTIHVILETDRSQTIEVSVQVG